MPSVGVRVPYFKADALNGRTGYTFDSAAGRPIVMLFHGSTAWQRSADAVGLIAQHAGLFDDQQASFFGVTVDPGDVSAGRIATRVPGIRWFLDYDREVSRAYGAWSESGANEVYTPYWLLLDSTLRVVARADIGNGDSILAALRRIIALGPEHDHAPVLTVPRVLEPELCRHLIALHDRHGGVESGVMRQQGERTLGVLDPSFKRRRDYVIEDAELRAALNHRIATRLAPQIRHGFQFEATRIERYLVACYDAQSGGYFRRHRDDTTAGTAHRKFACTINLNAEDYEGGDLLFPEYGARTYRAPTGGAVVFSCSLLHEAMAVTSGRRYAFLPFFFDAAGEAIRLKNEVLITPVGQSRIV